MSPFYALISYSYENNQCLGKCKCEKHNKSKRACLKSHLFEIKLIRFATFEIKIFQLKVYFIQSVWQNPKYFFIQLRIYFVILREKFIFLNNFKMYEELSYEITYLKCSYYFKNVEHFGSCIGGPYYHTPLNLQIKIKYHFFTN